ncbi:hypothetical protein EDF88_3355 [Buttiauxella sp. BIGb0552]|uniref:hypothetical protein n=1 Tax=Buttiauxella sp. BIGb0552 TaxID=2485120 RepID=UPI001064FEBC|nr:hypothetical protein [Buttiauxella sp. BIGb0552]TDX15908.1 hypothetical protein EDF88_3355 [Buttiauxella sp. BIGb0552]
MTTRILPPRINHEILLEVTDGGNRSKTLDFNRYNYLHFPIRNNINRGRSLFQERSISAESLYVAFRDSDYSSATKFYLFEYLRQYIIFCDKNHHSIFTNESVQYYCDSLICKNKSGKIVNSTYTLIISATKSLFVLFDLPGRWFDELPTLGKSQAEPYKSYSDNDLKKLLPLLRGFFKQISNKFLQDPDLYLSQGKNETDMFFRWNGKIFPVYGCAGQLMASAVYLMSYYTWANTNTLLSLERPDISKNNINGEWYQMPAFKRRAFRVITIQIGAHDQISIPKYSLEFFNQLLDVSKAISVKSKLLFQAGSSNRTTPLSAVQLQNFNRFLKKYFGLTDDKGLSLSPVISRFRATGSQLTQLNYSHIHSASLLGNSPKTTRKHYSEGNEYENQSMLQDSVSVFADKALNGGNIETSKKRIKNELNIEILTYENMLKMKSTPMRQAHGSYCKNPFGEQANKFLLRAQRHELLSTEKFACSDLLMCFSCPHQVVIAEPTDIWCLLSFKECIEESIYKHVDHIHFHNNYDYVLSAIGKILMSIDKKILSSATQKFLDEGLHPLWRDQLILYPYGNKGS